MQYRREIDGLRAVAVLPVILFHAGFSVFSGGYVGVDVFFVISGYLITSILIAELEQGDFSIARFYERRARRILPALFVVMFACLPFAYMWMLPSQLKDFAQSLVAVVFFSSNVLFWREDGYFAAAAELKPLLHTWSLAVEEQYYLLFPIFLLVLWRFGRQRVFWSVIAVATLSLLLAEWGWRNKPSANFYLAPTRAWELLAGSICAFMTVGRAQRSSNVLSALGLALIVFAIFAYIDSTPFPSVYTLVPVVGTALVILFAAQDTWVARLLSLRGFVGIGLISYSAYLWHQPLFAFARLRSITEPNHTLMAALAAASLLLAWATWYWVEQAFRKRVNPLLVTRRSVFAASGAVGAVFVALGLAGHVGNGFEWRLDEVQREIVAYNEYPRAQFYREGSCFLRAEQSFDEFGDNCADSASAVVIGDSHAAALASFLSIHADFSQYTASGCPPVLHYAASGRPHCEAINDYLFGVLFASRPNLVVLHANWISYWNTNGFQSALENTIDQLLQHDIHPVIVGAVPQFSPSIAEVALQQRLGLIFGERLRVNVSALRSINEEISRVAQGKDLIFWDPVSELCVGDDHCLAVVDAQQRDVMQRDVGLIAWDYGHLTYSGAFAVGSLLLEYISEANLTAGE